MIKFWWISQHHAFWRGYEVGSNNDMNIVAQFDLAGTKGTQRFYITKDGGYEKDNVENLGETNCGDPKVLTDFLKWGIITYPAEHYAAILWNHESAWKEDDVYEKEKTNPLSKRISRGSKTKKSFFTVRPEKFIQRPTIRGILYDDESRGFIDEVEIKKVLTKAAKLIPNKRFDLIGFDGCFINSIELSYQLKDISTQI